MEFKRLEDISKEQMKELRKICFWVNNEPDTDIYALHDNEDLKSVFILKRLGEGISTTRELDFGTKSDEQGKGYATIGFEKILEVVENRPDIKDVFVQSFNPITSKIAQKHNLSTDGMGTYFIRNASFDKNYDTLCEMIRSDNYSEKEIYDFCNGNGGLSKQADIWLSIKNKLKEKEVTSLENRKEVCAALEPMKVKVVGVSENTRAIGDGLKDKQIESKGLEFI